MAGKKDKAALSPDSESLESEARATTRGVVLIALRHPAWGKWAWNLTVSIFYHSKIHVQLVCDNAAISHLNEFQRSLFTQITKMNPADYHTNNRFSAAKAKLSVYDYLACDENLFLDVDAVCVNPLEPLFTGDIFKAHSSQTMLWANPADVKQHFNIDTLPSINSSLMLIKRGKEAKNLFREAKRLIEKSPFDIKKSPIRWYGGQPDELYMNVALAKQGIDPNYKGLNPLYCRWKGEGGIMPTLTDIRRGHQLIGLWGHPNSVHTKIFKLYDALMIKYLKELYGINHVYMAHQLIRQKA